MTEVLLFALSEEYQTPPAGLVGTEYQHSNGKRYKLVKNNQSGTLAKNTALKWSDRPTNTVAKSTALSDAVCGIVPAELGGLTVTDQYHFWMQIDGDATGIFGDSAQAVTLGDLVGPDDDADGGKLGGVYALLTKGVENLKTEAGLTLTAATTPTITQSANEELVVTWAAGDAAFAKGSIQIPDDFDVSGDDIWLVGFVLQTAANDSVNLDAEVYRIRSGAANSADLNPTAVAISQSGTAATPQKVRLNLAGNTLRPGDQLDFQLAPTAHANDAITCYGFGLEYRSLNGPRTAFAKALEAESSTDGTFSIRLLPEVLRAA